MNDGGMGSLKIMSSPTIDPRFGSRASECWFNDSDGVLVTAVLNLDQEGRPFEIDVWKVDFSPLKRWPALKLIRDHERKNT